MHTSIDKTATAEHTPALADREPSSAASSFHMPDYRPEAIAQRKLRQLADTSPQVQQSQLIQRMADNRSLSESDQVIQLVAIRGGGNLHGTVSYVTADNRGEDSAYLMSARGIKLKQGKHALAGDNSPEVSPPGWTDLQNLGLTNNAPHYKRMHLLNGQLGGHGNKTENLAPGSSDLNTAHHTEIEETLQNHVLAGGEIRTYDVFAVYRSTPPGRLSNDNKAIFRRTLASLHCQYELDDGSTDSKEISEGPNTAKAWP